MPGSASSEQAKGGTRRVFSKAELLKFRDLDICCCKPDDLPDMTVSVNHSQGGGGRRGQGGGGGRGGGGGGGRGGGGGQWGKEAMPNQNRRRQGQDGGGGGGGDQWARNKVRPFDIIAFVFFSLTSFSCSHKLMQSLQ